MLGEAKFPETLETERLVLRSYAVEDAAHLLNLVERNREQLVRDFAPMANELQNAEAARFFLAEKQEHWKIRNAFCYGIWQKRTKTLIGQLHAKNLVWNIPSAELAYFIDHNWQRQGYATETITAILQFAFQDLAFQRIFVRVLPSNQESTSLAKKLGFREEGLHRNAFRCGHGKLHDVQVLALTPQSYRPQANGY